ncbi:S-layer homology domain-containing protein [Heliobacterium gestii]|uniref:S-layer homology domain-containing protein n=1 Tax=Heliomicrobium gestii TaxID=2699 RepID=A0A845LAD1_HELGE|nr:S-layer homology domain-containing protein [Heliomicrobium gestii]MBM7865640.1 hypothetical protein [Heliomicrobium gestii]MZP41890.1 S-layer homology domain-containing protein [Heliomicrobium gestii]
MNVMMRRKKRPWTVLLLLISLTAFFLNITPSYSYPDAGSPISFVDIPSDHWAYRSIEHMRTAGLINGYDDGSYRPDNPVSREEFAALLVKGYYLPLDYPQKPTFIDVPSDHWSFKYVETAKNYLTGYYPPGGGKAFFRPDEIATREDIAVAIVKVMGLDKSNLTNLNILEKQFSDVETLSPQLRPLVALAVERKIINGYPDGTFRGSDPVTRAETAALLDRLVKTTNDDASRAPLLEVWVPDKTSERTVYLEGRTDLDATVTLNGKKLDVSKGKFWVPIEFSKEGPVVLQVVATSSFGRSTTVEKTVTYDSGAPTLTVNVPATSDKDTITISGTVTDPHDGSPLVTVNNETAVVWGTNWKKDITLKEGDNTLIITATNKLGKSSSLQKTVSFGVGLPQLTVNAPSNSSKSEITISGTISDGNDDSPIVTVNGNRIDAWNGTWKTDLTLKDGTNTITVTATNKLGKTVTVQKTVNFSIPAPQLTVSAAVYSSTDVTTISGKVIDENDSEPLVTVNGQRSYVWGTTFSTDIKLREGSNDVTVQALNKFGKSAVEQRRIIYQP